MHLNQQITENWFQLFVLRKCPHIILKCNHKGSVCEQQKSYNHRTLQHYSQQPLVGANKHT